MRDSVSVAVHRAALLFLGFLFAVVIVVFVGGHRFRPALLPNAIVGRKFSQSARHFADVGGHSSAARADIVDAHLVRFLGVLAHFAACELVGLELVGKCAEAREIAMIVRGAIGHRLAADVTLHSAAHFFHKRQRVLGAAQAIDAHHVRAGIGEFTRGLRGGAAVCGDVFIFEADRNHHWEPSGFSALDGEQRFSNVRKGFAYDEVHALGDLYVELLVEGAPHFVWRRRIAGFVHPGEAEISGDEAAIAGGLARDANGGAIQVGHAIFQADRGELVAAGVEGERLKHISAGIAKFFVQLEERFVTPFFAPRYLEQDFSSVTTARYLEASAATTEVEHTVSSIRPDGKTRRMLNIDRDETCLRLTRRTWVGSVPATETFFTYPGSRYTLKSRYKLADVSRR